MSTEIKIDNVNTGIGDISESIVSTSGSSSSGSNPFFEWLKGISFTTWLIVFLLLSFLGVNVFFYLAKGSQFINQLFAPIMDQSGSWFRQLLGQIVNTSEEGTKGAIDVIGGSVKGAINAIEEEQKQQTGNVSNNISNTSNATNNTNISNTIPTTDIMKNNTLNQTLNTTNQNNQSNNQDYIADDSNSSIQTGGKKGWCYIGEDRGIRSCIKVDEQDMCMSGDIFPSNDICVNPTLRA
jgi:hypothetical protein